MPIKLYITIDTEEDSWDGYHDKHNPVDNVEQLPFLQDLFNRFGAIPTYFVNYPVVTNGRARKILESVFAQGRCEIGAHCHPWNTPPFTESLKEQNTMMSNLSYDLVLSKLQTLHRSIVDLLGVRPICFRAGRWGFDTSCAKAIHMLGYRVDSSVTPLTNWEDRHGPNFLDAPLTSYLFDPDDILSENPKGSLLEVPPTIGFLQGNFTRCAQIWRAISRPALVKLHFPGILNRLHILNRRWLSPELSTLPEMICLSKAAISCGYSFLNISFHSTSLLPGLTPFVRSQSQLDAFLAKIEGFLQFASDSRIIFSQLSGALENENV